jgi:RimJ/RimL family protein N-acetyltransferase
MSGRFWMKIKLRRQPLRGGWLFRTISEGDLEALGSLMFDAYRGTIDYEGETREEAAREVYAVLAGEYGPFFEDCSYVIEDEGKLLSASMVVLSDKVDSPLLAFSMTHPDHKRKGMAEFLLMASINWLFDANYQELYLVVTGGNIGAIRLYEKLGFRRVELQESDGE